MEIGVEHAARKYTGLPKSSSARDAEICVQHAQAARGI